MRLKEIINFPLNMIVDVGVRSFKVCLEDDGIPVLHSKVVQRSNSQPTQTKIAINLDSSKDCSQSNVSKLAILAPTTHSTH